MGSRERISTTPWQLDEIWRSGSVHLAQIAQIDTNSTMIALGFHIKIAGLVWLVSRKNWLPEFFFTFGLATGNMANVRWNNLRITTWESALKAKLKHQELRCTEPLGDTATATAGQAHGVLRPACKQIKSLAWKQSGAKLKLLLDCFAGKSCNALSKTPPTIRDQEHSSMWMGQRLWQHPQARDYGAIIDAWIDPRLLDHMYKSMKSTNIPMKPATKPSTIHHDYIIINE